MTSQKKFGPIFACFYPFFHVKLRAQVQDLQKREFYDLPEHGAATTKARGGLGTIQTSWARRAIKIMADGCKQNTRLPPGHREQGSTVAGQEPACWQSHKNSPPQVLFSQSVSAGSDAWT